MKKIVLLCAVLVPFMVSTHTASLSVTTQVIINEIYYDSPGYDEHTFTELKGPAGASLDSMYLIGVNGYNGDIYAKIALTGYSIPADSYFVVGQDTGVQNADLINKKTNWQNGPDNVLLIYVSGSDTTVLDAVGYGKFTGSDTFFVGEVAPAPDVKANAGHSIARYPDGKDTDNNSADFVEFTVTTPGFPNLISDVAVDSIILPDIIYKDSTYLPCALIKNNGDKDETFKTVCTIGAYTDTVALTLATKSDSIVVFKNWTVPDTGHCIVIVRALLAGDMDTTNNSKTKVVTSIVGVEEKFGVPSTVFRLYQNKPNPCLGKTEINYQLPTKCKVKLTIYDLVGITVISLVDEIEEPGHKKVIWNGKDESSNEVAPGIYFYRLTIKSIGKNNTYTAQKKMIVLR